MLKFREFKKRHIPTCIILDDISLQMIMKLWTLFVGQLSHYLKKNHSDKIKICIKKAIFNLYLGHQH